MARRRPTVEPQRPLHTAEEKRKDIVRLTRRIAELEAFDPTNVSGRFSSPEEKRLETAIDETLSAIFGHGTTDYYRYSGAANLDQGPIVMRTDWGGRGASYDDAAEAVQYLTEGKERSLTLLRQAISSLQEDIELDEPAARAPISVQKEVHDRIFVVHGHDDGARESVARFLARLDLQAILLFEQPDKGLTVMEKFEAHATSVAFAVVLLTPDDLAASSTNAQSRERARQNVIFELGYFVGRLGRGRVCLLRKGDVEMPSDLAGVIYTDLDSADGWKLKLVRELKAAGLKLDANKVWD